MPLAREVGLRFLGAWQFLTLLPIRFPTVPYEEATVFFPLVGGLLGFLAGVLLWALLALPLSPGLASVLVLSLLLLATGFHQEDGLVRVADSVRAGRTPQRILKIMGNGGIGGYGMSALVLAFAVRWQSLADLAASRPWFFVSAAVAAGVLSRASMLFLAAATKPAGTGMVPALASGIPGWLLLVTGLQASVAASLLGWRGTAPLLLGSALLVLILRQWFTARLGGVNGYCLCACSVLVECLVLSVAAWQRSF